MTIAGFIRFVVFGALLVSLCVSRAEGLHLLPFDSSEPAPTSFASNDRPLYNLSPNPKSSFKLLKKADDADTSPEPSGVLWPHRLEVGLTSTSPATNAQANGVCRALLEIILPTGSGRSPPSETRP